MKKILFSLAAVAALVLSSCTKMDSVYSSNEAMGTEIKVTAMMAGDMQTKAVNNTTTAGLAGFHMESFRNKDTKTWFSQDFTKVGTTDNYVPGSGASLYWTGDSEFSFIAIAENNASTTAFKAPISGNVGTIKYESGKFTVTDYEVYTSKGTSGNAKGSGEIVGATATVYGTDKAGVGIYQYASNDNSTTTTYETDVTLSCNQNDPVVAVTDMVNPDITATPDVSLRFNHLLARISVNAALVVSGGSTITAKIVGYEVRGVNAKGTASVVAPTGTYGDAGYNTGVTWSNQATGAVRYAKLASAEMTTNASASDAKIDSTAWNVNTEVYDAESWSNIIPGTVTPTLVLRVAFYNDGTYLGTRFLTKTLAEKEYKNGYQYIINALISGDGGDDSDDTDPDTRLDSFKIDIVKVTVNPWQNEVGGTATFGA